MTEPSADAPVNWKFLGSLAAVVVVALVAIVAWLVSGAGLPAASPPPPPEPALVDLQIIAGSGAATGFDACAVLTPDVVTAAGLKYASLFAADGPEPGKAPGETSCGGPVGTPVPDLVPMVLLTVSGHRVTGSATSHGIRYDRHPGAGFDDVEVDFPMAGLKVTHTGLVGGEAMLAKLVDGVAANLAAGPKPAPGYRYPAPYDLPAKPCDALPVALFTTLTGRPTDGKVGESRTAREAFSVSGDRIEMSCTRASAAQETVTVTQTIYRHADSAVAEAQFLCGNEPGWTALPVPVGDHSCASPAVGGRSLILFHAGRERVLLEYHAEHPPAGDLAAAARAIHDALPA
ncbi:hypothetical protein ACIOD2_13180 [Amycolatopsis sp. NPDC088138]|uniref:hypothetical protein n=1 Tax=Amycolatopsis sp. NPDC088138 TaxID=3363938 RepID=UPI00380E894C